MGMLWMVWIGCAPAPECGVAECADVCARVTPGGGDAPATPATPATPAPAPAASNAGLSAFEAAQVAPILDDIRAGVRAFGDDAIGLCAGKGKTCDRFVGLDAGELPPGHYNLKAELAVPDAGERGTWKVDFALECVTTKQSGGTETTSTTKHDKSYDLIYAGKDRGFRLQPLWSFESPSPHGARTCSYTLTAPHPSDGAAPAVWKGSWSIPAAD